MIRIAAVSHSMSCPGNLWAIQPSRKASVTGACDSKFASGAGPWGAFVHPSGKFLYVTNNGEGTISGYTIDITGALIPISGSPFVVSGNGANGVYAIAFNN